MGSVRGVRDSRASLDVTQRALARRALGRRSATRSAEMAGRSRFLSSPRPPRTPPRSRTTSGLRRCSYLFIGLFHLRSPLERAPRAIHFYLFCLVSFILYSFHYSGKLNSFDWTIYWGNVVALLLQLRPFAFVHFCARLSRTPRRVSGRSCSRGLRRSRLPCSLCTRSWPPARWTFCLRSAAPGIPRHDRVALPGRLVFLVAAR